MDVMSVTSTVDLLVVSLEGPSAACIADIVGKFSVVKRLAVCSACPNMHMLMAID